MTTSDVLLFQLESIAAIVVASIGYSVLTPINMLRTERGQKEANEGDEILLEGITCTYFFAAEFYVLYAVHCDILYLYSVSHSLPNPAFL